MFLRRRVYQTQKKTTPTISKVRKPSALALVVSCSIANAISAGARKGEREETHVDVALAEEGEARKDHDGVEEDVLVLEEELGGLVERHDARVEGRVEAVEEAVVEGEEGEELDVGVVLGVVGDHCARDEPSAAFVREGQEERTVVNVVLVNPPAETHARRPGRDQAADHAIPEPAARDFSVTRVVCGRRKAKSAGKF